MLSPTRLLVLLCIIFVMRSQIVMLKSNGRQPHPGKPPYFITCEIEDVQCFVKTALSPWDGVKISQLKIDRVWNGHTSNGEWCQLLQIIDGRMYHYGPRSKPLGNESWRLQLYRARIDAFLNITGMALQRLAALRDTEVVFCLGDCVATIDPTVPNVLPESKQDPDFSIVMCQGSSAIPFPMFDVFRPPNDVALTGWSRAVLEIKKNTAAYPWRDRKPQVVFRGGHRTCAPNATDEGYSQLSIHDHPWSTMCGRARAVSLVRGDIRFNFEPPPDVSMPQHEAYKYVMYMHGHCHWANRLRRLLYMGMALFKQVGICEEFYALRLRPWVHYIPVDYNFKNLSASVEWAMSHEIEVLRMIERMHQYAESFNTAEFAVEYMAELLRMYAGLLDYHVKRRPGPSTEIVLSPSYK